MAKLPSSLERLIRELSKLPGVGAKSAQRLAFFLLKKDSVDLASLSAAVAQVKNGVVYCSLCHLMAETDPCPICSDQRRDKSQICVVEESLDVLALDKSGEYKGLFHVLGGVLNPLEGIGPEQLEIASLIARVQKGGIKEVIIATNPTLEGETTAMHLAKLLKEVNQQMGKSAVQTADSQIKISRIARGLPMGGNLEYADDITLSRAMEGRREY